VSASVSPVIPVHLRSMVGISLAKVNYESHKTRSIRDLVMINCESPFTFDSLIMANSGNGSNDAVAWWMSFTNDEDPGQ
jgi:hypothetical protein